MGATISSVGVEILGMGGLGEAIFSLSDVARSCLYLLNFMPKEPSITTPLL
jgi:hypothetical protein